MQSGRTFVCQVFIIAALILSAQAGVAAHLDGDLDGDGVVGGSDFSLFRSMLGYSTGDPQFNPAADFDGDGTVGGSDFGLLAGNFGQSGGDPDTTPPGVVVSLNDIPDDMNDLLVAPPGGFTLTIALDHLAGSSIDASSVVVTADHDYGTIPAGTPFPINATPTRAAYSVPAGTALPTTSHYLNVSASDLAGNTANAVFGFAVREFEDGAPLGNLQTVYLDFDQDRSLTTEIDFIEDMRTYGLSSTQDATLEQLMRDLIAADVVARANVFYGRNADGSPGPDPLNVSFVTNPPAGSHVRFCVGGEALSGPPFLGNATFDANNAVENEDLCDPLAFNGVFPQAIDKLWAGQESFHEAFDPLLTVVGTPVGEHALDAIVLDENFDPGSATAAEIDRWEDITDGRSAFAQVIATAVAHEVGHVIGLTAPGATPDGLFGGADNHNQTSGGATPPANYVMNWGGSFSFDEIATWNGGAAPTFRALNLAYLRNEIVLAGNVTGLFPAPEVTGLTPNPLVASDHLTITGNHFQATPSIYLLMEGDPTPNLLSQISFIDAQTVTGVVKSSQNPPGVYDVQLTNPDGQSITLIDALTVQ